MDKQAMTVMLTLDALTDLYRDEGGQYDEWAQDVAKEASDIISNFGFRLEKAARLQQEYRYALRRFYEQYELERCWSTDMDQVALEADMLLRGTQDG